MLFKLLAVLMPSGLLLLAHPLPAAAQPGEASGWGSSFWIHDATDRATAESPTGPHTNTAGARYATTGTNCGVCHASDQAESAFSVTGDAADDACIYCHVDDGRHADSRAYTGADGAYPLNGHTIGAPPDIPSSSVRQWLEPLTPATDPDESSIRRTIRVRRYDSRQMKLFRYITDDTAAEAGGGEQRLTRYGPTTLTCTSCHQPHNTEELIWKPPGARAGYKLLRASPSGSLLTNDTLYDPLTYSGAIDTDRLEPGAAVRVPEEDFGRANTGHNLGKHSTRPDSQTASGVFTTWTQWKGATETLMPAALSVWCADCHNLQMAANEEAGDSAESALDRVEASGVDAADAAGDSDHGDRTHTAGTGLTPCYACHRAGGDGGRVAGNSPNWEATAAPEAVAKADCDRCHYRADKYSLDNATNDFPHSGAVRSAKLLPDWYSAADGEALDQICKYCHDLVGSDT